MRAITAAIVGAGRIAGLADEPAENGAVTTHAQAYRRHPRFRLEAIVEPEHDRRERFRSRWSVPSDYATVDEMLAVRVPDVVSICSVTSEHCSQVLRLLEDGRVRAILCEKPVCQRSAELQSLLAMQELRPSVLVLVNHTRRFDPAHRRLASVIRERGLGGFLGGRCDYYGGWLHNGSHLVDTLRMLIGEVRVERSQPSVPGKSNDPCLDVRVSVGGGPAIDIFGFDEHHYQLFEIDLRFTAGRALIRNFGEEFIIEHVCENSIGERVLVPDQNSPWRGLESPLLGALEVISGYVTDDKLPADSGATLDEAAETMKVLWQAAEQAS